MKFGVVTGVANFLFIMTRVSSARKNVLISSKYKYFHVKIASLAIVNSCVPVGQIHHWQMFGLV